MDPNIQKQIDTFVLERRDNDWIVQTLIANPNFKDDVGEIYEYLNSKKKDSADPLAPTVGTSGSESDPEKSESSQEEPEVVNPLETILASGRRGMRTTRLGGDFMSVLGTGDLDDEDISTLRESLEKVSQLEPEGQAFYNKMADKLFEADFASSEWWDTLKLMRKTGADKLFMADALMGSFGALAGTALSTAQSIDEAIFGEDKGAFKEAMTQVGVLGAGTAVGAGVGAAAGAAAGGVGAIPGAVAGGVKGLTGAVSGLTDMMMTVDEEIRRELGNKPLTDENLRSILDDDEVRDRIRQRSIARGVTIGVVDGLTMAGSSRVITSAARKGVSASGRVIAGGAVEAAGGSVGELGAQVIAGDEVNMTEVLLEGVLEGPMVGLNVATTKTPSYNINGGPASQQDVIDAINSGERLSEMKVENDSEVESMLSDAVASQRKTEISMRMEIAEEAFANDVSINSKNTTKALNENFKAYNEAVQKGDLQTARRIISNSVQSLTDQGLTTELTDQQKSPRSNMMANSSADSSSPEVSGLRSRIQEYRNQASSATDPKQKDDLNKLADSLQREVDNKTKERTEFYDMVRARFPEKAKQMFDLDRDIERLKRQLRVEDITPEVKSELRTEIERKVVQRLGIEKSVAAESVQLTPEEKSASVNEQVESYMSSIDSQIETAMSDVDDMADSMGAEGFDPNGLALAEEHVAELKKKKGEVSKLIDEYKMLQEMALEEAQALGERGSSKDIEMIDARINELATEIGEAIGQDFSKPPSARQTQAAETTSYSAADQVSYHTENGGSTFGLDGTNYAGAAKAAVSLFNERTRMVEGQLTEEALSQYVADNQDILAGNEDVLVIGSWFNEKTNQTELDISVVLDKKDAVRIGKEFNQQAVWDLEHNKEINTEGDGKPVAGMENEASRIEMLRGLLGERKVEDTQTEEDINLDDIEQEIKDTPVEELAVEDDDSVLVPIASDGSPGLRAGDAGLRADEVRYINNLVKYVRSVMGDVPVRIHPSSASAQAYGLTDEHGGLWTGTEIHISPEAIKRNMAEEGVSRKKTFKETAQEEVMHAVMMGAFQKMGASDLVTFAERAFNSVASDADLSSRMIAKAEVYAGKEGTGETAKDRFKSVVSQLSEGKQREIAEEVAVEMLSALAGDQKVSVSTVSKIRLLINEFLIRNFGGKGLEISKNADLLKIAANFKVAANTGSGAKISIIDGSMVTDRGSKRISPTRIPVSSDGKIRVTTHIPIYKYDIGFKKEIGSEKITKEFNDVWHFINWWKKATKNGTDDYYTGFRTEDGVQIDVDRINGYNMRSSRGVRRGAASTPEGRRMAGRVAAAQQQGILPPIIANRMLKRIRYAEFKFAQAQSSGSALTEKYFEMVRNMDIQSKRLIEERAQQLGKTFTYYPDDPDTRASFGADRVIEASEQTNELETDETRQAFVNLINEFSGRDNLGDSEAVGRQSLQEAISTIAGYEDGDTPAQRLEKAKPVIEAVFREIYFGENREAFISQYFKGLDPADFYKNAQEETSALIDHMIQNGEIDMSKREATALLNTIMGIVSQRSDNVNNTLAATRIFFFSMQSRKKTGKFIDPNIIDSMKKNPENAGDRFGFVNSMVSDQVANNLEKLNNILDGFKRDDGGFDHVKFLDYLASETSKGNIVADDFGPKVGKFGLNLNGFDQFDTLDSHVINNLRTFLGYHVDFEEAYNKYAYKVSAETGLDPETTMPEENMAELKSMLHESSGAERKRLNRLYRNAIGIPESPKKPTKVERSQMEDIISHLSRTFNLPRRSIVQLIFADHQIYTTHSNPNTTPYNEFSLPLARIREEGLYKDTYLSDKGLRSEASLEPHHEINLRRNVNTGLEARPQDEVRASRQLGLFNEGSQNAEESPLFRRRTVEEVGRTKTGQIMTPEVIDEALSTDSVSKRVRAKGNVVEQGQKVGIRLNLNVLKNTGVPVQTVHDKTASGEALDYSGAVMVKNPFMYVNQGARKKIFTFQENKFPMASVNGEFLTSDITQMSFDGVKAFFNPFKQHVFVDASGRPIKSAEEATVVGNHVYLRGKIEYYTADDPIIKEGFEETESQRERRIKRGPKYEKALNRFAAYSASNGIQFSSKEDLMDAYDNMPIRSKVALDESEVAQNMEEAMTRASRGIKMRQTAGKGARTYPGVRREIVENPNNYFTPQSLKELRADLRDMPTQDLIAIMSNDGLGRLQNRNDDLGVLASAELINRAVSSGNIEAVPDIIAEAAAMGTTAGRILRHLRELRSSSPKGIEAIIKSAVEKKGNRLTDEQLGRLQNLSSEMFRLQAEHEDLVRRAIAGEPVDAELKAKAEELKKIERELDTFANAVIERGWGQIGTMLIQGNLLTPMSQITNVGANMINALGKVAVDAIALPVERIINAFGIESHMKRNYSINAYMYGVRKFGSGFVEALDSIVTGQEKDVSEWRVHRGFAPFRSLMSAMGKGALPMGPDGKASISQRAKLAVQGTLGIPAEVMFRFLSLGDVPFRRAVEGIELYQAGRNQGLEGDALAQFIKHPTRKARELAEIEGRKLTYQERTTMSEMAEDAVAFFERQFAKGFDWIPGVDGTAAAKFLIRSNLPYVRTPANILMDTLTYVSPYVAAPRIMNNLKNREAREAAQNFGKLVVGSMVSQTAVMLLKEGLISGSIDWNEDEEKNIAYDQFPPNSINVSGLQRWLEGGDAAKQADDYFISYMKLGVMGAIMGAIVKGVDKEELRGRDYEGIKFATHALQDSFGVGAFSSIAYMMDQSFLQGMNTLVDVISSADAKDFERNFENWFRTTFQAVSATAFPNTLSAVYRGTREYLPDTRVTKDMDLMERLIANMTYTIKDRTFGLSGVPVRTNWKGEPIRQNPRGTTGIVYQLFDITKARQGEADPVSNEMWRLYESTEDLPKVVGTPGYAEKRKLNVPNIKKTHMAAIRSLGKEYTWINDEAFMAESLYLNVEQINRLMEAGGKERYAEVEAFINSEKYQRMDDEERIEALNEINDNYNSAIEKHRGSFREHTKVLFDILQEIYDGREEV